MNYSFLSAIVAPAVVGLALLGCGATPESEGPVLSEGITRDFTVVTTAGDEISGASIRGHVTIVEFWAVF
jgi:hypothetical protein